MQHYIDGIIVIGALTVLIYSLFMLYINRQRDIFRRYILEAADRQADSNQWDSILKDASVDAPFHK